MELSEAITGRRSVRSFESRDVPEKTIEKLIDAACYAPSAGNIQPWAFVIVRNWETKKKIAMAAFNQDFIEKAPVVIIVCADQKRSSIHYGRRGEILYCLQDTAAATQNILLTAYSLGLGTCWVGAFDEHEARKVLQIPEGMKPVAIVPVGYPIDASSRRIRKPLKQIVHYEEFLKSHSHPVLE